MYTQENTLGNSLAVAYEVKHTLVLTEQFYSLISKIAYLHTHTQGLYLLSIVPFKKSPHDAEQSPE